MPTALALAGGLLVSAITTTAATAADSTSVGAAFGDGLDSRAAASAFAEAAARTGYTSSSYTSGRLAADAWSDGLSSAVFGVFGHGNAGLMQTAEGLTDDKDQFLVAGDLGYLSGGNLYFWSDYLPFVDVDDMKLAVFAGCYTGNVDYDLSSFGRVGAQRGVDAVVGFTGLVYYPAFCGTSCNYSGNYFWQRFSTYAENGATIADSLSRARADLVAKEGDAGGWEQWHIDGSVDAPSQVKLTPAGSGQALTSQPFGLRPFDLTTLSVTSQHETIIDGRTVQEVRTAEGVNYRLDMAGDLIWLSAQTSSEGPETVTAEDARRVALEFAEEHVSWFNAAAGIAQVNRRSHGSGDARWAVSWRQNQRGPQVLEVEVDQRTGSVVDFVAERRPMPEAVVRVARSWATAAALAVVGEGVVVDARLESWEHNYWRVTVDRAGDRATPDLEQVLIDAGDGSIVRRMAT